MKNRLHLLSTFNTRDLGGYPAKDGNVTKYNRYFRSDRMDRLSSEEVKVLEENGVTLVLDLRSQKEVSEFPNVEIIKSDMEYVHFPFMNEFEFQSMGNTMPTKDELKQGYLSMAMNCEKIKKVCEILASSKGAVLFHCSAGQDRTGIVAMLLLMIAHVEYCDIVNDYLITSTYLKEDQSVMDMMRNMGMHEFRTDPDLITTVYQAITNKYQTIEKFLESCGVEEQVIQTLHDNFVQPRLQTTPVRRLPLQKGYNCRELGGYVGTYGMTQFHRFLRSSDISKLNASDLDYLSNYGIHTVIDLRAKNEVDLAEDATMHDSRFYNIKLPFMPAVTIEADATKLMDTIRLSDIYISIINAKEIVYSVLKAIADVKENGILFHCSAGKDRTGVLAMLLLMIAHVEKQDIIASYQQTFYYWMEDPEIQKLYKQHPSKMLHSDEEEILRVYEFLLSKYESIEQYCTYIGLNECDIEKIRCKLVK